MENTYRFFLFVFMPMLLFFVSNYSKIYAQNDSNILIDIDGNTYKTEALGHQTWMVENLKTTKLNDGTEILNVTDVTEWVRTTKPAYSWCENNISNKSIYGGYYNWHVVNTGKLCPEGWHVPTDNDWTLLFEFLGGNDFAFQALKERELFAIQGGYRYGYYWGLGEFYEKDINGYWWTATVVTGTHVWSRTISYKNSKIYRSYFTKNNGFCVRCIKNK